MDGPEAGGVRALMLASGDATSSAARARAVVGELLQRASFRSEVVIGRVRIGMCAVFFVRHVLLSRDERWTARDFVQLSVQLVAIVCSLLLLARLRRTAEPSDRLSLLSVLVDVGIVLGICTPAAVWPAATYLGLLATPMWALFLFAIVSGAFRFRASAMRWAIVLDSIGLVVLLGLEQLFSASRLAYGPATIGMGVLFYAGMALGCGWLSNRTRLLVFEAAEATLTAERARQRLGAYVSDEIAAQALAPEAPALGGQRQAVAVLFSDLRGFTTYAENLPPERLVSELNGYLEVMVPIIRREGGVVDKYIGDAIMAVFGVPAPRPDDAARALRAAAAMQAALRAHNEGRAARGLPPLLQGIGVHYGPAVAGNVGTTERLQYTVVGDTVNLASRLESITKREGVEVLISADARAAALAHPGDGALPALAPRGTVSVPGRGAALDVYTLAGASAAERETA